MGLSALAPPFSSLAGAPWESAGLGGGSFAQAGASHKHCKPNKTDKTEKRNVFIAQKKRLPLLIDRKNQVLRLFSRSFDGVTGGIAVPFTRIGNAVLENFFGIGVGEEIGAHQRLVDGHKVNSAEDGAKIATHTFVKLFAGFK